MGSDIIGALVMVHPGRKEGGQFACIYRVNGLRSGTNGLRHYFLWRLKMAVSWLASVVMVTRAARICHMLHLRVIISLRMRRSRVVHMPLTSATPCLSGDKCPIMALSCGYKLPWRDANLFVFLYDVHAQVQ